LIAVSGVVERDAGGVLEVFADTVGAVWANADGIVTSKIGDIVDFVETGAPLSRALPMMFGLDAELAELVSGRRATLKVPSVSIVTRDAPRKRLNVTVRWHAGTSAFVILVTEANAGAVADVALQQEVRRRQFAETLLAEQAADIAATNRALAEVNTELAEFAHVVSHDLKAPMRALRYFADGLEQSLDDPGAGDPRTHLERLREQSRRMTAMLSSLLSYARLERLEAGIERIDTSAVVRDVVRSLPNKPTTDVQIGGAWPTMDTVPALLDLVLRNLIENALRFADPGRGVVRIRAHMRGDDLMITIEDNGPGIAKAHQAAVFRPFTQIPGATPHQRDQGSSGMGLALVKRALDRVGGAISITSDPDTGPGCKFELVWPAEIAAS